MFQNNPLLAQLKQQIEASKEYVEGRVKASDKAFGFLECEKKAYFIPPVEMKKVMHGFIARTYARSFCCASSL